MLKNYLTIAIRHLLKQKAYSLINGFGLATGIAFCLLIFVFVEDELSFDRFHANAGRIYRINKTDVSEPAHSDGKSGFFSALKTRQQNKLIYLPIPLGPLLQQEIPEVKQFVRYKEGASVFSNENKTYNEEVQYVDTNFFEMFSFKLEKGDKKTVLADPSSIVLTSTIARKFFGEEDPVGKTITMQQGEEKIFTITGVCADAPYNSSLNLSILVPFEHVPGYAEYKNELHNFYSIWTFVELAEHTSSGTFRQQLSRFADKHFAQEIADIRKAKKLDAGAQVYELGFTNITDTHFDYSVYWPKVSNPLYTYILSGIALLILFIACINYISLALADASSRIQEIGIRKVIGASRNQVAWQLWIETQVLILLAVGLSLLLVQVFMPAFNYFTDKQLSFQLLKHPNLVLALILLTLFVGVIVGGYPAFFLSRFQPVKVLKSNRTYRFDPLFSSILVVVQYTLCLFLVTSSMIMYRQMDFISRKDMGYNKEQVLVIKNYAGSSENTAMLLNRFKQYAATNPDIVSVSGTSISFSKGLETYYYVINGENSPVDVFSVDGEYIPTLGIELIEGRNFSDAIRSDTAAVIINQTLAAQLGKDAVVGEVSKTLKSKIVGIVKDHHYTSLESKIAPMLLFYSPGQTSTFLVTIKPGRIQDALFDIQKAWKGLSGEKPFDYSFLDEDVAGQYKTYQKWMGMMGTATAFAIFIGCLGLFGLAGLMAMNRTKEIGIRKVMGASLSSIFFLLNKRTIKIAVIAFITAVPFSWYLMHKWLEDFAYRISITWEIFAIAGLVGMFTAIVAISLPTVKAALANPVKSLRNE